MYDFFLFALLYSKILQKGSVLLYNWKGHCDPGLSSKHHELNPTALRIAKTLYGVLAVLSAIGLKSLDKNSLGFTVLKKSVALLFFGEKM